MNAICSQPEVADDVIFSEDIETFSYYASVNLWIAIFSIFWENVNHPFMQCVDDQVNLSPILGVKEKKM